MPKLSSGCSSVTRVGRRIGNLTLRQLRLVLMRQECLTRERRSEQQGLPEFHRREFSTAPQTHQQIFTEMYSKFPLFTTSPARRVESRRACRDNVRLICWIAVCSSGGCSTFSSAKSFQNCWRTTGGGAMEICVSRALATSLRARAAGRVVAPSCPTTTRRRAQRVKASNAQTCAMPNFRRQGKADFGLARKTGRSSKRYGVRPEGFSGELDHLVPISLGGSNDPDNLWPFHAQATSPSTPRTRWRRSFATWCAATAEISLKDAAGRVPEGLGPGPTTRT
mgnify:CR=1 FL=1